MVHHPMLAHTPCRRGRHRACMRRGVDACTNLGFPNQAPALPNKPPPLGSLWLRIVAAVALRLLRSAATCILSTLNTYGAKDSLQFVNRRSPVRSGSPAPFFSRFNTAPLSNRISCHSSCDRFVGNRLRLIRSSLLFLVPCRDLPEPCHTLSRCFQVGRTQIRVPFDQGCGRVSQECSNDPLVVARHCQPAR